MKRLFRNSGVDPEFKWLQNSEEAALEFESGRLAKAIEKWKSAHAFTHDFEKHDPRHAASLNNLAIAFRLTQNFGKSEHHYRSALEAWESSSRWVSRMSLEPRARSSLFHLRMERKHQRKYDDIARRTYQQLLPAGHAGTLNNLGELLQCTGRFQDAGRFYGRALRERLRSMLEKDSGVAIIRRNLANLPGSSQKQPTLTVRSRDRVKERTAFISKAGQNRWIVDTPPEFTDEGRFMAAILLTHVIDHIDLGRSKLS